MRNRERGFALAGAILALVVIASLITGAFFAARQELNVGRSSQTYQRAFDAAETGIGQTLARWVNSTMNSIAVGATAGPFSHSLAGGTGFDTTFVTRLNNQLYLIRSIGRDQTGASRRQVAALARMVFINLTMRSALTTKGSLTVGGSSYINGVNATPAGWGCSLATDSLPGILTRDSTQITFSGCNPTSNPPCIAGSPKIQPDATINDSTFFKFGDQDWNALIAMATKVYGTYGGPLIEVGPLTTIAPVGTATTCNTGAQDNWGEPGNPPPTFTVLGCRNYFPVTYVNGNLKITGGRGQGVLLVEGNLDVQGGFKFYGPVVVRGILTTQGTGGHFNGGVMAANVNLSASTVLGNAVITYSSCAVASALQGASTPRLLGRRSWAEITQ